MKYVITEEMIQKKFIINKELDAIIPRLSDEKFAALKAAIKMDGLQVPISVMTDKTVIDGHNRLRACRLLKTGKEDGDEKDFEIDFNVMPMITTIKEAKEYSIEINFHRRQMIKYVAATWANNALVGTDKEIAEKIGLDRTAIYNVRSLNKKLSDANASVPNKVSDWKKELNSEDAAFRDVLATLTEAENITNLIATIEDKKFKKELEEKFYTAKYEKKFKLENSNPSKKEVTCAKCKGTGLVPESKVTSKSPFKALQTMIDQHDNPELYLPVEESAYATAAQKVAEKINEISNKYPEQVKVFNVTTEDGFIETSNFIRAQAGTGKLYAIVTMFELPKELVPDA